MSGAWCRVCQVGVHDTEEHLQDVHQFTTWSSQTLFQFFEQAPPGVIDGDQRLI